MAGDLVWMVKGGERLPVHPTCVADHQRLKWRVDDAPSQLQAQPIQDAAPAAGSPPKRRGRKPKTPS